MRDMRTEASTEQLLNAVTHGIGVVASVVGGVVLMNLAVRFGDGWDVVSVAVYVTSLVLLYSASTLFHSIGRGVADSRLRIFDHCAIYFLIAGSYTPFALGPLRGALGWSTVALVWLVAIAGILHKCFAEGCTSPFSTKAYVAMGWLCGLALLPGLGMLASSTLLLLAAGGLAYMVGTLFYSRGQLPYAHPIWHGFVLIGSGCHFVAVLTQLG